MLGRVIDAHVHCSDRKDDLLRTYARKNGLRYDLRELLQLMAENDVSASLLLSPPVKDWRPLPNREVLALCRRSRDSLFPVLTVEPDSASVRDSVRLAKMERGTVKGFKILLGYRPVFASDRVFGPLYDYAEEEGLPVLFHTGDTATSTGSLKHAHPMTLDELANERQDLRIVICHMGNPWILESGELLYKHKNVYADISGLVVGGSGYAKEYSHVLARRIQEAIYYADGAGKVLFGTDYPVETHRDGLSLVSLLKIAPPGKERVLSRNSAKLLEI